MRRKKKDQSNYLDFIPEKSSALKWHLDEKELIVLEEEHTGRMDKIVQKLFKKPRVTQIHLDEQGSYLWPLIDGKRNIHELAEFQKEHFGEKAEPLYPRIIKYFQIMESYHFVRFINKPKK